MGMELNWLCCMFEMLFLGMISFVKTIPLGEFFQSYVLSLTINLWTISSVKSNIPSPLLDHDFMYDFYCQNRYPPVFFLLASSASFLGELPLAPQGQSRSVWRAFGQLAREDTETLR